MGELYMPHMNSLAFTMYPRALYTDANNDDDATA